MKSRKGILFRRGIPANPYGEEKKRKNVNLTKSAECFYKDLAETEGCSFSEILEKLCRGDVSEAVKQKIIKLLSQ